MHHVEVKRRMGEDDLAAIAALANAAERFDHHAALGEHKWLDLVHGGREGFAGFVAREQDHGQLVGYAQLSRGTATWGLEVVVHPAWRDPKGEVQRALVAEALAEVARQGGGHVHLWVPKPTEADDLVAAELGLARGRELLQLRRRLPLEGAIAAILPVATRPFRPGVDDVAWLALNNRAFRAHPEQGAWDASTLARRMAQPWFDPAGFLLHEEAGELVAFCWTKVHPGDPPAGEIYVIGVDPAHAGRGLGTGVLRAGLAHLEALGLPQAMLYVDADNVAALGLYRRFGFRVHHHDRAYVVDVARGP
jgi:mycothiol synthase